ncbi:MAG: carboxymuconolactone decarboxylase family protein, partial [Duncaniella sp.]|nr:carboxymuconolactone decarboxylase family protein [Duncaniella sp.]
MKGITIILLVISAMTSNFIMDQQKIDELSVRGTKVTQTAGRKQLGDFAPEFARLNDDVLFGEGWSRNDLLSLRDRSLVTVTSLISQGITDSSLTYHLQEAKKNGITRIEISEIITHIA